MNISIFDFSKCIRWSIIVIGITSWFSCIDHDVDEPPVKSYDIGFDFNSSIAVLKSKYVAGKFTDITDDLLIHAVVVADDRSGNFYKTLVIQDSTGGIELKLNNTGLYNNYPVGIKIGLKCKGLTIGDYNGLIQLGQGTYQDGNFTNLSGIEAALIPHYVFKGPRNQLVVPNKKTILTLTSQDLSTLIELEGLEFVNTDTGKTFADATGQTSVNLNLMDCNKNKIILRSSGYADFAAVKVPVGNGKIKAILSKFRTDVQLYIRDTSDLQFQNDRCNSGTGSTIINLKDLRALFGGTTRTIPDLKKIRVSVISDKDFMNTTTRNIHVQDASGGIVVRFSADHSFSLHDELEINISNQELSEFNGLLQVNDVPLANALKIGTKPVVAVKKTIAEILADFENLESTLVRVDDVLISKSGDNTYSGSCNLTDASGTMVLFTRSQASFASSVFQTGRVKITAFVNQGGASMTRQLTIRSLNDITP
jgi:hypothetical protein